MVLPDTSNEPLCETPAEVELRNQMRNNRDKHDKQNKADKTTQIEQNGEENEGFESKEAKLTDGEVVQKIILDNVDKFAPRSSIRASVRANKHSNSINCLLECPDMLTTSSFGIRSDGKEDKTEQQSADEKDYIDGKDTDEDVKENLKQELRWTNDSFLKEIGVESIGSSKEKRA